MVSSRKTMGKGDLEEAMPTEVLLTAIVLDRHLSLSPDSLRLARSFLARFRQQVEQVRSVELAFLPPYIEPQTAVRWIENGGRSKSQA
jgi:hypothetical protein